MQTRLIVTAAVLLAIAAATAYYLSTVSTGPVQEPTNVVEIEMTTKRYRWDPNVISGAGASASSSPPGTVFADTIISVKAGSTIIMHIKNLDSDTAHGFQIDEFGVNAFIPPGETVTIRFVADKSGTFMFFCNVFCGVGHPFHRGSLTVQS